MAGTWLVCPRSGGAVSLDKAGYQNSLTCPPVSERCAASAGRGMIESRARGVEGGWEGPCSGLVLGTQASSLLLINSKRRPCVCKIKPSINSVLSGRSPHSDVS